jgi:hypothetical protein
MRPFKNGQMAIEYKDKHMTSPYKLWRCDIYVCPSCGERVLTGWSSQPVAYDGDPDFAERLEKAKEEMCINFF